MKFFALSPMGNIADITTAMSQHGKVLWQCLDRWRFKMETWTGPGKEDRLFKRKLFFKPNMLKKKSIVLSSNFPGMITR